MHRLHEIAEALLGVKGISTVALREGFVSGRWREPKLRVVAGEPKTEKFIVNTGACSNSTSRE